MIILHAYFGINKGTNMFIFSYEWIELTGAILKCESFSVHAIIERVTQRDIARYRIIQRVFIMI